MKKVISILFVCTLIISFAGCDSESVAIDGHNWKLTFIQSSDSGAVIGCASEHYEMHKEIEGILVVDIVCTASDGKLTIADNTNENDYVGAYSVLEDGVKSTMYEIQIGDESGSAVTAYTEYVDGASNLSKTPTLIITIGDYTLNFQSDE